ncbi:unnamed protein product [Phytophthora lilii]|uniref:Unnamed protein product n=1 Tax=Phytophthora lilii TaxID=2077276 RepID=A0A9W6XFV1_9STRA|nr:unnamed protein product [Phytophthora lilii]
MLRAHDDPRTDGAEERGGFSFSDVVDEVLAKMRGEKLYKRLMKSNSMKELDTLKDPRVKEHLVDIVFSKVNAQFKTMDEVDHVTPTRMAEQLLSRRDLSIEEQNFLVYFYTKYWYEKHPFSTS